tara:strand:- start:492 stop:644 length:153 start_codon:yes stop_codon:yes gene_type:complete
MGERAVERIFYRFSKGYKAQLAIEYTTAMEGELSLITTCLLENAIIDLTY